MDDGINDIFDDGFCEADNTQLEQYRPLIEKLNYAQNKAYESSDKISEFRGILETVLQNDKATEVQALIVEEKSKELTKMMGDLDYSAKNAIKMINETNIFDVLREPREPPEAYPEDEMPKLIICGFTENNIPKLIMCPEDIGRRPVARDVNESSKSYNNTCPPQPDPRDCLVTDLKKKLQQLECQMRNLCQENAMLKGKIQQLC